MHKHLQKWKTRSYSMARARNIKPAFFSNDLLADIEPLGRLFFIGLWTIADYQGNIEWRERRLKAQILPYDDCDVKEIAINLDKSGFIRFYSDGDTVYLNVTNFCTHQNPHKNERDKGSEIPSYNEKGRQVIDFKGLTINRDLSGLNQGKNGSDPADSLNLIPDSLNLPTAEPTSVVHQDKPKSNKRFTRPSQQEVTEYFIEKGGNTDQGERFFNHYESNGWKVGRNSMKSWKAAVSNWLKNSYSNQCGGQQVAAYQSQQSIDDALRGAF